MKLKVVELESCKKAVGSHVLEVKADSAHNVLIRRETLVDHVGVVDDISTEKEGADDGIDEIESTVEREEDGNKASEDHRDQGGEKEWPHARKVILRDVSLFQEAHCEHYLGLESKQG